jgi:hypothetical protein
MLFLSFPLSGALIPASGNTSSSLVLSKESLGLREIKITNRLQEISIIQMKRMENGLPEDKELSQEWNKLAAEWSSVKREREKLMEKVLDSPDTPNRPAYQKLRP